MKAILTFLSCLLLGLGVNGLASNAADLADRFDYPMTNYGVNDQCLDWKGLNPAHPGAYHVADDYCNPPTTAPGSPVYAAANGTVRFAHPRGPCNTNWVHLIVIEHELKTHETINTIYGHVVPSVADGQSVTRGQQIGVLTDLDCTTDHVHYGVYNAPYCAGGDYPACIAGYLPYANFPGDYLSPTSFMLIGRYPDGWHVDGTSQKFFDAWVSNRWTGIEVPKEDEGNPSGLYVHQWQSQFWVQNFDYPDSEIAGDPSLLGKQGAAIWRSGGAKAHVIRGGFWNQYRFTSGPDNYGAPVTDEGCWVDENHVFYPAAQQFEHAVMRWTPSMGTQISVQTTNVPTGILTIAPCSTVLAQGFTGSDENGLPPENWSISV